MTKLTDAKAAELRALHRNAAKEDDDIQFYSGVAKRGATEKFYHAARTAIPALLNEREELIKENDRLKADAIVAEEQYLQGRQEEIAYATNMRDERDAAVARAEELIKERDTDCFKADVSLARAESAESALSAALSREKALREALDVALGALRQNDSTCTKVLSALNASKKETGE